MADGTQLWIAGKWDLDVDGPWEVVGVFDTEEKAVAQCLDWRYFVGPELLNVPAPHERTAWPGCYYPKAGQAGEEIANANPT